VKANPETIRNIDRMSQQYQYNMKRSEHEYY